MPKPRPKPKAKSDAAIIPFPAMAERTYEELRGMELEIVEGPPPVVSPEDEARLVAADPKLADALRELVCRGGDCSEAKPCDNCGTRRRYLALLLHREANGRCAHPAEAYDTEPIPLPQEPPAPKPLTPPADGKASEVLLRLAEQAEYWNTSDGTAWATIECDGHHESYGVGSRDFRRWLARAFYLETKKAASAQTLVDVLAVLEARANYDGPTHPVFVRVAWHEGRIYLYLADKACRSVEIDENGWQIIDVPPVRFRHSRGILALPEPESGGSLADLRPFVNVSDEHWPLVLGWLVAALRPVGPYAILELLAEQGSGKTTLARVLRALVDPNSAPVRSAPRGERDLMIAANNSWLIVFDNLSWIEPELSDALCRLATGGGFATRTLYENDSETIFDAQRPVLLNGIEGFGSRSDLLDRSLIVELPRIEPGERKAEKLFWAEFEAALPRILGALLDAVSAALRNLSAVDASDREWPRMADFAMWVVAAEEALGLESGEFLEAYAANRETAHEVALDSSILATALRNLLMRKGGTFEGTATQLLDALGSLGAVGLDTRVREWPKNGRALAGKLTRLAPNLRAAGMTVEQVREDNHKLWRIEASLEPTPAPSPSAKPQRPQFVPRKAPEKEGAR